MEYTEEYYKRKYLKYKRKYLNLKKEHNGGFMSLLKKNKKKYSKSDKIKRIVELVTKVKPFLNFINNHSGKIQFLAKGASIGATVASFGLGGDTMVELGMVTLEVLGVVNQIVNLLDLFNEKEYQDVVGEIIKIQFTGAEDYIEDYDRITEMIDELDNIDYFIETVCTPIQELLSRLGGVLGNLISTGIPNDNFVASTVIQNMIDNAITKGTNMAINKTVDGINDKYSSIPESFRKVLEDPEKLAKNIESFFGTLRTFQKISMPFTLIKKDMMAKMLEFMVKNNKDIGIVLNKVLGLVFFILNFMRDYCIE